ncbi:putative electron transfer flavoprotein beta subunit [Escherichia coli]|nr:putative electron transfer flavoprotein beta subunit [Escherichia coli]
MRLTGEIMKIITCFKLVPEEQDIVVTPEYTLNSTMPTPKSASSISMPLKLQARLQQMTMR